MEFVKYRSIENAYREKFLEKIRDQGLDSGDWVVTEKIHGQNCSLWTDGTDVKIALRTYFIPYKITDNPPLNKILEEYKHKILGLFYYFVKEEGIPDLKTLAVFGEHYGGTYPHPEVKRDPQAIRIQKGVYYSPHNRWAAYDLRLETISESACYAHFHLFKHAMDELKIPTVPILAFCSFEMAVNYINDNESLVYLDERLPMIKDNICEGIVIRPVKDKYLWSGQRVILKSKNAKFSERSKEPRVKKDPVKLSDNIKNALDDASKYVNTNRLNNVVSKLGKLEYSNKDFKKILGLFIKDILEDYEKDYPEAFDTMDKAEKKLFGKNLSRMSALVIREFFIKNV